MTLNLSFSVVSEDDTTKYITGNSYIKRSTSDVATLQDTIVKLREFLLEYASTFNLPDGTYAIQFDVPVLSDTPQSILSATYSP